MCCSAECYRVKSLHQTSDNCRTLNKILRAAYKSRWNPDKSKTRFALRKAEVVGLCVWFSVVFQSILVGSNNVWLLQGWFLHSLWFWSKLKLWEPQWQGLRAFSPDKADLKGSSLGWLPETSTLCTWLSRLCPEPVCTSCVGRLVISLPFAIKGIIWNYQRNPEFRLISEHMNPSEIPLEKNQCASPWAYHNM